MRVTICPVRFAEGYVPCQYDGTVVGLSDYAAVKNAGSVTRWRMKYPDRRAELQKNYFERKNVSRETKGELAIPE